MMRKMHTNFARTIGMQFPNQRNENVVQNPSGLFTLAQCQQQTIKTIFSDSEIKNKNLKLLGTSLKLLGAPNFELLPAEATT
jgi:hypothetical protein